MGMFLAHIRKTHQGMSHSISLSVKAKCGRFSFHEYSSFLHVLFNQFISDLCSPFVMQLKGSKEPEGRETRWHSLILC